MPAVINKPTAQQRDQQIAWLEAENAKLRAALKDARHFFLGHFDDSCEECRRGDAVIREALGLKD